jgi:RNA polymerase sigma-70 factor (ECF subfamily)
MQRGGVSGNDPIAGLPDAGPRLFELGRAAWPQILLEFDAFCRYFGRHAAAGIPPDDRAADMFLACACGEGVAAALSALESAHSRDVARAIASIDSCPTFVEETLQAMRERLFTRCGPDPGKIADYGGRASLRSWLRTVSVRAAISIRRRKAEQRHELLAEPGDERIARGGPEFEYLLARYKQVFESAVQRALERLSPKERMLLRLTVIEGMSIDQLSVAYHVGRSTAARWIAGARAALFEKARREVHEQVLMTSSELDSLAVTLQSQLDVSVLDLLRCEEHDAVVESYRRSR